jgi:hypothetical protein
MVNLVPLADGIPVEPGPGACVDVDGTTVLEVGVVDVVRVVEVAVPVQVNVRQVMDQRTTSLSVLTWNTLRVPFIAESAV